MALIDKASLLFVPSVVAEGKAFNILPSGNRAPDSTDQNSGYDQTRADFDFNRGSNAAATRIGSDGLIKKYRENLLTYSNDFSNAAWNKNAGGSFTSGQSGYDGTNNAWQFNVTTASNSGAWQNITFSGVATFSAYFKKGTIDKIGFTNYAGSSYECWFDLTNGTIGQQTGDLIDAKIEAVGTDGWYRCSITDVGSGNNYFQLKPSNAYSGTSTAGHIFIQSAQVESSLVASSYLDSTSVTGKAGVLVDLPRINYDANGQNASLLLEPSRQNLVAYSEYFGDSSWSKTSAGTGSNAIVTDNYGVSPEGLNNASRLQLDLNGGTTASDISYLADYYTATGVATTNSIYMKSLSGTANVRIRCGSTFKSVDVTTDWQRFDVTDSSTSDRFQILIYGGINSDTADLLIWGAQAEAGNYVSSYIPTMGTSETRAADSCSVKGVSDVIGQTEGTLFGEFTFKSAEQTNRLFSISGADWNTIGHIRFDMINLRPQTKIRTTGADVAEIIGTEDIAIGSLVKFAVVYTSTTLKMFVNGAQIGSTDRLSGSLPSPMNEIVVDALGGAFVNANQNNQLNPYKQAIVFKEALTDAEAITLTTL